MVTHRRYGARGCLLTMSREQWRVPNPHSCLWKHPSSQEEVGCVCTGISESVGSQGWHRSHNVTLDEAPSATGNSDDAVGFLGGLQAEG